jgi:hypothetical protein
VVASVFASAVAEVIHPSYRYLNHFFAQGSTLALQSDGHISTHPLSIQRPMKKLSEADNWFDDISYNKGAAVLRMARAWLNANGGGAELLGEQNMGAAGEGPLFFQVISCLHCIWMRQDESGSWVSNWI